MTAKRFQVALSFPGEYRDYVSQVAETLAEALGIRRRFSTTNGIRRNWRNPTWMCCCSRFTMTMLNCLCRFCVQIMNAKQWCGLNGGQSGFD